MSTSVMAACWPLTMPPTAKAVLISLADNANDRGECWPSLRTISERTCFSERAVQGAIRWLESAGVVKADRTNGRHTQYLITPEGFRTPAGNAPVPPQELHPRRSCTPAGAAPPPRRSCVGPPQEVPSNRKEPSRTKEQKQKQRASAPPLLACPPDVDEQTWNDWLALRKAKRAPATETVLKHARSEAAKAGMTLERFLVVWCARGSQGLEASWLKPHERDGPQRKSATRTKLERLEERKRELLGNGKLVGGGGADGPSEAALLGPGGRSGG